MLDVIKVTIKEKVDEKGVTLYRLAKDSGVAYSTLWKLNTGRVQSMDFEVLSKLCEYFQCQPNDLLKFETSKSSK